MAFLVSDTNVEQIDAKAVNLQTQVPVGIYQPIFDKFRGTYLINYDYRISHGKVYGDAQKIADHIVAAFKLKKNNLGVLLSGNKGLGKSLTAKLVVEQLRKTNPVIVVSEYLPGLFDYLKQVSNAVILFDEFEKTMQGHKDGSDDNTQAMTIQDEMLSLLDGTSVGTHNLYILTCNKTKTINDNFKSRPGRICYHYRYEGVDEKTIRSYCADNLKKKELENDIVDELLAIRFASLDIVQALVDEVNNFDVTVNEVMQYLNIEIERIYVTAKITYEVDGVRNTRVCDDSIIFYTGCKELQFSFQSTNEEDKQKKCWYASASIPMEGIKIPLVGMLDVSAIAKLNIGGAEQGEDYVTPRVLSVEIGDEEAQSSYSKVFGYENSTALNLK